MDETLNPRTPARPAEPTIEWEDLRPVLDDVIDQLSERERDVVLLRFFENRPFAEIGAALRTSEDAARMRVERALDKLRVLLERRGIRSTAGALATALSGQTAFARPSGLTANVTASALAGAAAATGGGIAAIGLMKLSTGTVALGLALCASLTGNAWLLSRSPAAATAAPAGSSAPARAAAPLPQVPADLVKSADLTNLRDQMRSAGANDASIRAALGGILQRRYREQLSRDNIARLQRGWWRDHERTWGTANDIQLPFPDLWLMQRMVDEPLEQLLGPAPATVEAANVRYDFLPENLRQELGRLDRMGVVGWAHSGQPEIDEGTEADVERRRTWVADRRKELLASLTSAQRDEYEMHFGDLSAGLARQLQPVAVTEPEFRAVFPIAQGYARDFAALPRQQDDTAQTELDARTAEKLVTALGYERALDTIWAASPEYAAVSRVAREANLPPTIAGTIVQLAAETARDAMTIHERAGMSDDEKRAALLGLQASARAQVDALLPATAQQRAGPQALAWLNALGEGRYQTIWTALPGLVNVVGGGATISVTEPRRGYSAHQLVPRRPGGN